MGEARIVYLEKAYENMDEATIGAWQAAPGEHVRQGQVLVELTTDKRVVEIEAPADAWLLAIFASVRSTLPVGYALAAVGEEGDTVPDVSAANEATLEAHRRAGLGMSEPGPAAVAAPPIADTAPLAPRSLRAAPAARALARRHGLDLAAVAAHCGRDLIHRQDVEAYLEASGNAVATAPMSGGLDAQQPLAGRIALVTGASGAIGSAISRRLAKAGALVVLQYCRNAVAATALADELNQAGARAVTRQADLTDPDQCATMVADIVRDHGGLHVLVNNAGILDDSVVAFMSDAQWDRVLALNLRAPFLLIRAAAMTMARARFGRIVNIASDAGRLGSASRANYAAAKEGLVGLTRSAAREMAGAGVLVNAVSPGFVDSAMTRDLPDARRRELVKGIPLRRFGLPEDVAEAVFFLCLPQVTYITGQVLFVDGGLFMG